MYSYYIIDLGCIGLFYYSVKHFIPGTDYWMQPFIIGCSLWF